MEKRSLVGAKVLNKCFEDVYKGDEIPAHWFTVVEDKGATLEVSSEPMGKKNFFTITRDSVIVIE